MNSPKFPSTQTSPPTTVTLYIPKGIKGNYDARRAYGLSCSPRQAAVAWKRIDYLYSLLLGQEVHYD
ncbi:hypothetical protein [Nostoc sp. FACHB-110]|uniref:hypothetical protein n=1 Tax=Nostoc sp. FACHB-110 TaxID=2692834 RepID=UPI001F553D30|nr:hypothetical protein [Nostoc sp. FACHB-110]